MNKQRKVLITITYNEMGIIIDTKTEELGSSAQPEKRTEERTGTHGACLDTISRQAAIDGKISVQRTNGVEIYSDDVVPVKYLENLPSAQPTFDARDTQYNLPIGTDLISRQAVLDAIDEISREVDDGDGFDYAKWREYFCELPPEQPERDTPKRVLWTGWKGHRYTRYNCPNCKKPVRNDDVYCHRCGQRLMFPKVSHTPYVEGQKQEVIVRWDDE